MKGIDCVGATRRWLLGLTVALTIGGTLLGTTGGEFGSAVAAKNKKPATSFSLVRSETAQNADCLGGAKGKVKIFKLGFAEKMVVSVSNLPKNTEFDLFVIQGPNAPFGLSWYQGDLTTDSKGKASKSFVGRFSEETFIVAPGSTSAPIVHPGEDENSNPATDPVHTAHLGLWFNAPADAAKAGCGNGVTPFNGDHTAGVQAMSTRNAPANKGPLLAVKS